MQHIVLCALGVQSDPARPKTVAGGDALVFGEALSAPGGMDRIQSRMGVCPQFDILWKELTGREHLRIYGAIKVGLPPVPLEDLNPCWGHKRLRIYGAIK